MRRITEAEARTGYVLWIRFEDGIEGEIDLSDMVGRGVFEGWKDPAEFKKVSIDPETWTVSWPGGLDLCPDSLYEDVTGIPNERLHGIQGQGVEPR